MATVLNWLWQGVVVAVAAAVLLRTMSAARTRARSAALWTALGAVLALPVAPMATGLLAGLAAPPVAAAPGAPAYLVSMPAGWWTSNALVLGLWAGWCAVYAIRLTRAFLAVRFAAARCRPFPAAVEARLAGWRRVRDRGRHARLVVSGNVRAAAVLGVRSPVIAIAPPLVALLDDAELDRVVLHEWTHVQRRDGVANLLQSCVSALTGWHPAVWWINRQLRVEREMACDEAVVTLTGNAGCYAACLVKLADLRGTRALSPLLAAPAAARSGLRRRIVRILALERGTGRSRAWRIVAIGAGGLLAVLWGAVGGVRAVGLARAEPLMAMPAPVVGAPQAAGVPLTAPAASVRSGGDEGTATTKPRRATAHRASPADVAAVDGGLGRAGDASPATVVAADVPALHESAVDEFARPSRASLPTLPRADVLALAGLPAVRLPLEPAVWQHPGATKSVSEPAAASPWHAAAQAGVTIGRTSQKAAVATAGFFARLGKRIAGGS